MKLYIIWSEHEKKCLQGYYAKSDLKAYVPYKQFIIENKKEAILYEVDLKNKGKFRKVAGNEIIENV